MVNGWLMDDFGVPPLLETPSNTIKLKGSNPGLKIGRIEVHSLQIGVYPHEGFGIPKSPT